MTATSSALVDHRRLAQLGLALLCILILTVSTRWGIGIKPDSTAYLGLRAPDPGLAPLYRWIMHGARELPWNVVATARAYHVVLYAATAALAFQLLLMATGSAASAWAGSLLIALSGQTVKLYSLALSDPTFIVLVLLGLALLWRWAVERTAPWWLAAAAVAALAALARFPGVALAGTGALTVLALDESPPLRRLGRAAAFGTIALAPIAAWLIAVEHASGTFAGRSLSFHPVEAGIFRNGLLEAARFLLPTQFPVTVRLAALAAAAAALAATSVRYYWPRPDRGSALPPGAPPARAATGRIQRPLPAILVVFMTLYAAVLVVSVYIEPALPLHSRYLLPEFAAAVLLGSVTVGDWARSRSAERTGRAAVAAAVVGLVAIGGLRAGSAVLEGFTDGHGFTGRAWRNSQTVAFVRRLPPSAAVYSNDYDALLYLLARPTKQVPPKLIRRLGRRNPDYKAGVAAMRRSLAATGGVLVYFADRRDRVGELPTVSALARLMPLRLEARFADGAAYALAPQRAAKVARSGR